MRDLHRWAPTLTAYADWLPAQSQAIAKGWSRRLNSAQAYDVEGAVAEASVWDFIGCRCDSSRLAETPGDGGLEFEFVISGAPFLVEVTNISIESASKASGMPDGNPFSGNYGLLTGNIRPKVRRKFRQARQRSDLPVLVAVTALHSNSSRACVDRRAVEFAMGSPPSITGRFNPETGVIEGDLYQSTDLTQSVFLSPSPVLGPDGVPAAQARFQLISGFLLAGFGLGPKQVSVLGGLNPEAARPFDPSILPDVPFCSFREWPATTKIAFRWTITEDEEREREFRAAEHRLRATGHGALLDGIREEAARRTR